jgi:TonB family protein
MLRRTALALPLALVLGCGATPPPQTATPPPAEAAPASPAAAPASPAAAAAPSPAQDSGKKDSKGDPAVSRAVAADAPLSTKISQDDILALVQQNSEPFYRCYSLGAGATKSYRAKVTVRATVSPVGAVNAVEVVSSTAKNPKVDACVVEAFKKLTFARAAGSGATVFTFPLSFDGMQQVP